VNVVIDGRFVLNEADLHRRLAGALGYGPRYRYDVDDLREHLAAGDPRPVQLVWVHAEGIRMALGVPVFDELVGMLREIATNDAGRDPDERFVFHILG